MGNERKNFSENEKLLLYNEVNGRCPKCKKNLLNDENRKIFDIAHIYPLNPSNKIKIMLEDMEIVGIEVNDLDNVIALCKNCHKTFDTNLTKEKYKDMVSLKKSLLHKRHLEEIYHRYTIEDEINLILDDLCNLSDEDASCFLDKISYKPIKLNKKINSTMPNLTKRSIKNNITNYYMYIKERFIIIEKSGKCNFNAICGQMKTIYSKIKEEYNSQLDMYESLIKWLTIHTRKSGTACEIVISFFIENCEVFEEQ